MYDYTTSQSVIISYAISIFNGLGGNIKSAFVNSGNAIICANPRLVITILQVEIALDKISFWLCMIRRPRYGGVSLWSTSSQCNPYRNVWLARQRQLSLDGLIFPTITCALFNCTYVFIARAVNHSYQCIAGNFDKTLCSWSSSGERCCGHNTTAHDWLLLD